MFICLLKAMAIICIVTDMFCSDKFLEKLFEDDDDAARLLVLVKGKLGQQGKTAIQEEKVISQHNKTIVFDIDETICCGSHDPFYQEKWKKKFPMTEVFTWRSKNKDEEQTLCMLPHIDYAFAYLLQNNWDLHFFSSGLPERNEWFIPHYFQHQLGKSQYDVFKTKGQFKVFSRDKTVETAYCKLAKNLKKVGFSTEDSILIDDKPYVRCEGEEEMINVYQIPIKDGAGSNKNIEADELCYAIGAYLIGVFQQLDQLMLTKQIRLRSAVKELFTPFPKATVPASRKGIFCPGDYKESLEFEKKMIQNGLEWIKKMHEKRTRPFQSNIWGDKTFAWINSNTTDHAIIPFDWMVLDQQTS